MDALTFLSSQVALFEGLSQEELTPLAVNAKLAQLAAGQIVLRAGMTVDDVYVIATGSVDVLAKVPNKGMVVVGQLGPGDVFGEVSIVEKTVAGATIKAGAEGAYVLLIPEAPFQDLLAANEAFKARVQLLLQARRAPPPKT
jgi:CRP-like cAMP-binding protein